MKNEAQIHETDCPDIEMLAALLDGRLEGAERERVVDHLGRCEACYEVFTETRHFQEEEGRRGQVLVHPATRTRLWWAAATVTAAAALALLVVVPLWQGPRKGSGLETGRIARDLTSRFAASELLPLAYTGDGWSRTRGFGTGLNDRQRAFRLGVRTVDLEIALRANDRGQAERLLHELSDMARDLPLPEMVLVSYDDLLERLERGDSPLDLTQRSAAAADLVVEAAEAPYFELGQWAEAGRLAAGAGDGEYSAWRQVRNFASELEPRDLPDELRTRLADITDRLDGRVEEADLPSLAEAFTELVKWGGNA